MPEKGFKSKWRNQDDKPENQKNQPKNSVKGTKANVGKSEQTTLA